MPNEFPLSNGVPEKGAEGGTEIGRLELLGLSPALNACQTCPVPPLVAISETRSDQHPFHTGLQAKQGYERLYPRRPKSKTSLLNRSVLQDSRYHGSRFRGTLIFVPAPPAEDSVSANPVKSQMILIAGPYRSGKNDDPDLIRENVARMESYALPIFRAGHIPILGEWLALPLVALAGSLQIGDKPFDEIFHPIAVRLLQKCDAVLRVGGPSAGADEMVRVGRSLGLEIYATLDDIPDAN